MIDVMKMLKARMYMKRNEPFLSSWHAYVGYELELFKAFERPVSTFDVADAFQLDEALLEQWVHVGVSIGHLKDAGRNRYKTWNTWKLPKPKGQNSSGVLLKEMMELHIPTLLNYPEMMRTKKRRHFEEEKHAPTVAETSRMLEVLALPKIAKRMKEQKSRLVLDIGCGEAGYIQKLAERFPHAHFKGLEISPVVAEKARQLTKGLNNVDIDNADLWEYKPDRLYDMVMMNNVIHYIDLEERQGLFTELAGWLQDGGVLSVITPIAGSGDSPPFVNAFNSFFSAFDNLYRLPSRDELTVWGEKAGMTMLGIQTVIKEGSWYVVQYRK
ncbi:class I SAM-dependent methyltransferase [Planococcus salinus]|uniref:Class I SAM-dependent methyltransferase n=1 Tax=Planococcus salinus TaxID=1848460 RepID=A0A3M8P406_9BACL|nr:class I SAM-dependent methyltransferase [Planococcus salinus]RNF38413.1 class I SAM-dependent methyltransferase [Planococcus salinus]